MRDFGVFLAPGQAYFLQRHLRRWAENFQKVLYEKVEKFLEKYLSFQEIHFGHAGTISRR